MEHKILDQICLYPMQLGIAVVLCEGEIGDYAAYLGGVKMPDAEALDIVSAVSERTICKMVASWGTKLSFEQAKGFFPYIEKEKYRDR